MGTLLLSGLWLLSLLSLVLIVGADVGAIHGAGHSRRMYPTAGMLAVDALLLIGVGLGSPFGLQLAEESPRFDYILLGLLPLLFALLGSVLAAWWFIAGRLPEAAPLWRRPPSTFALVLGLALVLVTGGAAGVMMDSAAVLMLLLARLLASRLGTRGLRTLHLGAALCLLWAGAFLIYLRIFPVEIVVETVWGEEGAAIGTTPADPMPWIAPLVFLAAFLLGFFKRQRG